MKQAGYVFRKGDSWFIRYRESLVEGGEVVRKQRCKKLCAVAPEHARLKNPPQSVLELAEELLSPLAKANPESTQTLSSFMEHIYFPWAETQKRASTMATDKNRWDNHLKPRCGLVRLREFRTVIGEQIIAEIARQNDVSRATLKQMKSLLSAVFTRAKCLGLLDGINPMQGVSIPKNVRGKAVTFAYSLDEIKTMLSVLPEPSRTAVAVAGYSGLRRGEIQGLRWSDYAGKQFNVEQSIWEGIAADPKSQSSKSAVPVIPVLARILDYFRLRQGDPSDSRPIFRASNGSALRLNNLLRSQILPALNRCKVCAKSENDHEKAEYGTDGMLSGAVSQPTCTTWKLTTRRSKRFFATATLLSRRVLT